MNDSHHDEIRQIFQDIEHLKSQMMRVVSDAESEKGTSARAHDGFLKRMSEIESNLMDILYGKDRISGLVIEMDRLKQESERRKHQKTTIIGLCISVSLLIIKTAFDYFTKNQKL